MESFLFQSSVYLLAACAAVPVAVRLGLGSVLGYLVAGVIIGPLGGLVGSETESLQHFAEFGVVMMLFLIGLELEPRALWDMRHKLVGLGGLQVSVTTGLIALAAGFLGQPASISIAIGLVFALSSTAIVLQTLNEKKLMGTGGGRSAFSVLLTQDIAVIPMLIGIPLLSIAGLNAAHNTSQDSAHGAGHGPEQGAGQGAGQGAEGAAEGVRSLIETLPNWGVMALTLAAVVSVILAGHFLTRPIFRYIGWAKLREMYVAVALLFVVGVAVLMLLVGLSPALGTFLAGVVLANSEFRHELEADIEPFKGLLLGLFFITVGAGINFNVFFAAPVTILGLTLGMMLIKAAVLFALAIAFKIRGRDKVLFTLSLAQAGEFGFVLVSFSVQQNAIPTALSETLLLVVALSMLLTPLLFIGYDAVAARMGAATSAQDPDTIDEQGAVIIAGVGRFGQVVNRLVTQSGFKTTVLDHDLDTIQLMRRFGFKGFFGDPTRPDLLHSAGLETASVLVVALDDREAALKLVRLARKARPDLHIIARAYDRPMVFRLFKAGANDIVREMFDSSLRAGRYVLERMGLSDYEAHIQTTTFYDMDRVGLKQLAQLWREDIPAAKNEPYIDKAKELNRDLEAALLGLMNERNQKNDESA